MTRLICLLTVGASVIVAAAVATAASGPRPVDRGAPTVTVVPSPSIPVDGFDWVDAGIGAAAASALGLVLVGVSTFGASPSSRSSRPPARERPDITAHAAKAAEESKRRTK